MIIHVAESGQSFELEDCQASTKVEEIQDVLASLTGVNRQDQLLFSGDARLDPHKSLGFYRLVPGDERPIFLFNRQRLAPNSPLPPRQEFPANVDPVLPEAPLSSSWSSSSSSKSCEALVSSERRFRHNFQKGHAILSASQNKLDACHKLAREIHVQDMALATVRCSMEQHYKSIQHVYGEFVEEFQRQSRHHSELLAGLSKDLERLRACKLHPALQCESRVTLLDCVKERSLRKAGEECASYHKQLCAKVAALANEYAGLKRSVEDFLNAPSAVNLESLERTLALHSRFTEEQSTILQSLRKDVSKVKRLSDDYADGRYSSMQVQDALLALGPMHDVQVKSHLPRMEECDSELRKLLEHLVVGKNSMIACVHQRMQAVAALQASMKLTRNQISGFREVMVYQEESFQTLGQARRAGISYKACLAEVVRRKSYMKLYFGQAGQLAEKLATKREREMARREEFLQTHSGALPRDLIAAMGLLEVPSQCFINLAPFDSNLLDVELSDIDKYAPRQLSGTLRKEEWCDPPESRESEVEVCGDEISGTSRLEVQNARLRAQLAASIAYICSIDPGFQPESLGDAEDQEIVLNRENLTVAERTAEALKLKDEHAQHLNRVIYEKEAQCNSYEARIRELEERLREQEERTEVDAMVSSDDHREQSENSAITGAVEPMDGAAGQEEEQQSAEELKTQCLSKYKDVFSQTAADESVMNENARLRSELEMKARDLEMSAELLRQCQMNSAHLENRLHEAREEAQIHLCAADRRASEYNVLRASTVKLRGLLERLRSCIASPAGFTDSLRSLSASLPSDGVDDLEFRSFVSILAERVTFLAQQRAELAERCKLAESSQIQLRKEAESKAEMAKSLFTKCKLEKQASKEKICLTRFEVHELALFLPNAAGHYEALNKNRPNYFLSEESIALFHEHYFQNHRNQPQQQLKYILGQIVHIEHHSVGSPNPGTSGSSAISNNSSSSSSFSLVEGQSLSSSMIGKFRQNCYGLAPGTEYWVVTVAMVLGF